MNISEHAENRPNMIQPTELDLMQTRFEEVLQPQLDKLLRIVTPREDTRFGEQRQIIMGKAETILAICPRPPVEPYLSGKFGVAYVKIDSEGQILPLHHYTDIEPVGDSVIITTPTAIAKITPDTQFILTQHPATTPHPAEQDPLPDANILKVYGKRTIVQQGPTMIHYFAQPDGEEDGIVLIQIPTGIALSSPVKEAQKSPFYTLRGVKKVDKIGNIIRIENDRGEAIISSDGSLLLQQRIEVPKKRYKVEGEVVGGITLKLQRDTPGKPHYKPRYRFQIRVDKQLAGEEIEDKVITCEAIWNRKTKKDEKGKMQTLLNEGVLKPGSKVIFTGYRTDFTLDEKALTTYNQVDLRVLSTPNASEENVVFDKKKKQ